uniref:CCHC-type domain-containing protein n=1 Tax=Manihot esculenta TaxID=3983 RepID=A0A2C9VPR0_MANES
MESRFATLNLVGGDEENEVLHLEAVVDEGKLGVNEFTLVGRFITHRKINFGAMRNTLSNLWRPRMGVFMQELGPKLYMFQFFHEIDLSRVIQDYLDSVRIVDGGPWTFNNSLLVTHHLQAGENPAEVPLVEALFWVQVFNVPVGYFNELVAELLGNFIGRFVKYDSAAITRGWQSYMRLRVAVDIRQPLIRAKKVHTQGGKIVTVSFKYERLSTFCYNCGRIGHKDQFCEVMLAA